MKILLISPTEKGIGGVAQHVQGLSNFLTNNVLSDHGPEWERKGKGTHSFLSQLIIFNDNQW